MTPIIILVVVIAVILYVGFRYRMMKPMLIMLVGLLLLAAFIGYKKYQGYQGFMAMKEGMAHMTQTVSTTKAVSDTWLSELSAVGTLRAAKGADLSSEVPGVIQSIHFTSGDEVKEGALLIQLRADDEIARLKTLEAAARLAEINLNRNRKQLEVKAVSQATVDNDVSVLAGARAQVEEQRANVEKRSIRAPFSGYLGIRNVDVGQYINAGTAIVTLQQLDPIYLDFNLPQQSLAQIKTGQKISVMNDTYPDMKAEGEIIAINPKVDTSTRNVGVRATLPNPDHKLLPGMYATARIMVGDAQSHVTLPQTVVTYNPYGNTVFVVHSAKGEDGKEKKTVEQVFVTVGETRGDQVQILSGVKDGDEVVSSGQLKLQNGSAITVNNEVVPKNDANPMPKEQ